MSEAFLRPMKRYGLNRRHCAPLPMLASALNRLRPVTRQPGMLYNRRFASFAFRANRSSANWLYALCLPMLIGCSVARPTLPMALPQIPPMPPVPRLVLPPGTGATAGDLFRLTLDLYEDTGECRRRLNLAREILRGIE